MPGWLRASRRCLAESDPPECPRPGLLHRAAGIRAAKDAANAVIVEDRAGLLLIDPDSVSDHTRGVVGALHEMIAAMGACAIERQPLKNDVERTLTSDADSSPRESLRLRTMRPATP